MLRNRRQRTFQQLVCAHAAADAPGGNQQLFAGGVFQLMPKFVGAVQQRNVRWVLMVCQPDHPADSVGRTHLVGNVVLLQSEHPPAAPRQAIHGGAAHSANSDDYGIKLSHVSSCSPLPSRERARVRVNDLCPRQRRARRRHAQAVHRRARREQHGAEIRAAKRAVRRNLRYADDSQVLTAGREHPHATGTGAVHAALGVHLHAVGHSVLGGGQCCRTFGCCSANRRRPRRKPGCTDSA